MPDQCMQCGKPLPHDPDDYWSLTHRQSNVFTRENVYETIKSAPLILGENWFVWDTAECMLDFIAEARDIQASVKSTLDAELKLQFEHQLFKFRNKKNPGMLK